VFCRDGNIMTDEMTDIKLLSFADFEIHAQKNEWICNDEFDPEICPDHLYFRIDTELVSNELDVAATKILDVLGVVAKDDGELRHIQRNAFELRHIAHGRPKSIFFTGPAGVGKSSLLNALLNMIGLAKTGAKGGKYLILQAVSGTY
jgi:type IV secretory pathway ATPase VirB11/archaellum biosynthesis ATPase